MEAFNEGRLMTRAEHAVRRQVRMRTARRRLRALCAAGTFLTLVVAQAGAGITVVSGGPSVPGPTPPVTAQLPLITLPPLPSLPLPSIPLPTLPPWSIL